MYCKFNSKLKGNTCLFLLDGLKDIKYICCSRYTSYALSNDNSIYSFGSNKYGLLGINQKTTIIEGIKNISVNSIQNGTQIIKIHSGTRHVGFITNKYKLFLFGWNSRCQCGIKTQKQYILSPKLLIIDADIETIKCGGHHNVIKTRDNDYYTFGWNHKNECLVDESNEQYIQKPHNISHDYLQKKLKNNAKLLDIIPTNEQTLIIQSL